MISEESKSPYAQQKLPAGYLGSDGKLISTVTIQEMTGVEEDLLSADLPGFDRQSQIIANCISDFGGITDRAQILEIVKSMATVDRDTLLLGIRKVTNGPLYRFKVTCPFCKKGQTKAIDLDSIEIKPQKEPGQMVYQVTTPRGALVEMKVMGGQEEAEAVGLFPKMRSEVPTLALMLRVKKINGEPVTKDAIKKLPMSERRFLQKAFRDYEGEVDSDLECTCDNEECKREFTTTLSVGDVDFFYPLET